MPLAEPLHDGKTLGDLGYSKLKVIYAFALAKAEITVSGCVVNNGTGTTYQEQVAVKIQDLLYGGTLIPDHDKRESLRADVLDRIQQYFKTGILPKITPGEVGCLCLPVVLVTAVMSRPHTHGCPVATTEHAIAISLEICSMTPSFLCKLLCCCSSGSTRSPVCYDRYGRKLGHAVLAAYVSSNVESWAQKYGTSMATHSGPADINCGPRLQK